MKGAMIPLILANREHDPIPMFLTSVGITSHVYTCEGHAHEKLSHHGQYCHPCLHIYNTFNTNIFHRKYLSVGIIPCRTLGIV